ncbi:uncharacterized protein LOC143268334 isoform X2 [Peromyscus maniculatus bairdii]|uniref:uncharacterized protein LOC143268334 isoform X2 n=1 Tax=Peromyscus maniculatus bairdii TaxID=230844 RepID=UPI003FD084AF
MAGAGSDGEALAPRMQIIEMNDKLRNRQEIVNGLNIFLEENEEASLEELEEESDVSEEEETETLSEDGPKEAHNNVRASHKVSLRSITSMTDEERFNMRIKKFGINTSKEFRKSPGASWKRREGGWNVSDSCDSFLHLLSRFSMSKVNRRPKLNILSLVCHQFFNLFMDIGLYL